jgi:hypothetical protein
MPAPDIERRHVFISYSTERRSLTEALARDLEAQGISIWWDTSLLAADKFREEIERRIDDAHAVIVIWTPESIRSYWVKAEADRAWDLGQKLINTHTNEVHPRRQIPMPFNQAHSVDVTNRPAIIAALRKFGVLSSPLLILSTPEREQLSAKALNDAIALEHWKVLQNTNSAVELRAFLDDFADSKLTKLVRERLVELEARSWVDLPKPVTNEAIDGFLTQFPDGAHAAAAQILRVELQAEAEWLAIKKTSDPKILRKYLINYGKSKAGQHARDRLTEIEAGTWAALPSPLTIEALDAFETLFPNGANAEVARKLRKELHAEREWQVIKLVTDPKRVQKFVSDFGEYKVAQSARDRLIQLEASAWTRVSFAPTLGAIDDFLAADPAGGRTQAAKTLREEIKASKEWEEIKLTIEPIKVRRYISDFGHCKSAKLARDRLSELEEHAWAALPKRPTVESLDAFLTSFPGGARTNDALDLRAESIADRAWERIRQSPDPASVRKFISEFDGRRASNLGRARLLELEEAAWRELPEAQAFDELPALAAYLDQFLIDFPGGRYEERARAECHALRSDIAHIPATGKFTSDYSARDLLFKARSSSVARLAQKQIGKPTSASRIRSRSELTFSSVAKPLELGFTPPMRAPSADKPRLHPMVIRWLIATILLAVGGIMALWMELRSFQ